MKIILSLIIIVTLSVFLYSMYNVGMLIKELA